MITAQQARNLSDAGREVAIKAQLDKIYSYIRNLAEYGGKAYHHDRFMYEEVRTHLIKNGFQVIGERPTIISW